jgi:hypothetical protein
MVVVDCSLHYNRKLTFMYTLLATYLMYFVVLCDIFTLQSNRRDFDLYYLTVNHVFCEANSLNVPSSSTIYQLQLGKLSSLYLSARNIILGSSLTSPKSLSLP